MEREIGVGVEPTLRISLSIAIRNILNSPRIVTNSAIQPCTLIYQTSNQILQNKIKKRGKLIPQYPMQVQHPFSQPLAYTMQSLAH